MQQINQLMQFHNQIVKSKNIHGIKYLKAHRPGWCTRKFTGKYTEVTQGVYTFQTHPRLTAKVLEQRNGQFRSEKMRHFSWKGSFCSQESADFVQWLAGGAAKIEVLRRQVELAARCRRGGGTPRILDANSLFS
jgi:hypothetical protein